MITEFTIDGWDDFEYWMDNDRETADKIRALIRSIKQTPFKGLENPNLSNIT